MINIVLYQPEIPPNTGNIVRTCMALNARLHLIGPLGFSLDEKSFKRAGMDYLKNYHYKLYNNFTDFIAANDVSKLYLLTRFGTKPHSSLEMSDENVDYYFLFGGESKGLPDNIKNQYKENWFRIPMHENARSLNLSNAVAIVAYEAARQQGYIGLSFENTLEG